MHLHSEETLPLREMSANLSRLITVPPQSRKDLEAAGLLKEIRKAMEYPLKESRIIALREKVDSVLFRDELQLTDDLDKQDDRFDPDNMDDPGW